MRDDQYLRLQALEEKLTDQFLFEAEPEHWPGNGVQPRDMTQHDRGDRYWCKKNAVATIALVVRVGSLIGRIQQTGGMLTPGAQPEDGEGDETDSAANALEAEIAEAEREASKLLARVQSREKARAGD